MSARRRRSACARGRVEVAGAALAALLLSACVTATPAPAPLAPERGVGALDADEQHLWKKSRELQHDVEIAGLLFVDRELDAYLARVLDRVLPDDLRRAGLEPSVHVVSNVNIHGYSFANGVVYLHTALLARMADETQLATVLTRELAHVKLRNALRAQRDARIRADSLAWIGVGSTLVQGGAQIQLLAQAASISTAPGFHHSLEVLADREGLAMLAAAGYDVKGTPGFFEMTLDYVEEVHGQGAWGWVAFSPPPAMTARIAGYRSLVESQYADAPPPRPPLLEPQAFRRRLQPATLRQADLELAAGLPISSAHTARLATEADANDADAWLALARALAAQREKALPGKPLPSIHEVRDALDRALRADPRHAAATRELALSYYRPTGTARTREDARTALRHFRRYLSLAPRADDAEYVRGYVRELTQEAK
ncbi:MAG: M48 family metalloprotease [Myxococcota bacterium]